MNFHTSLKQVIFRHSGLLKGLESKACIEGLALISVFFMQTAMLIMLGIADDRCFMSELHVMVCITLSIFQWSIDYIG